jgi:(p)ppGpp synthase/HD superfamily hydrolase
MPLNPDAVVAALTFAAKHHLGQTVSGPAGLPYLLHVGSVAMEVVAALSSEPAADAELSVLCAILHDSIEDTEVTHAVVAEAFGAAVADGVLALSKDPTLPKDQQMDDSLRRIRTQPKAVWKVKLADRVCNLQPPPPHWSRDRCAAYHEQAADILAQLGTASPVLAERLRARMSAYPSHWPQ